MSTPIPDDEIPPIHVSPETAAVLARLFTLAEATEALTDAELANAVIDDIWGEMRMGTREGALLDELLHRFEGLVGIERDDEGMVVKGGEKRGGAAEGTNA